MPIFEYSCGDCGTKFEKLVRRSADASTVRCPSCGQDHLTSEYSTFAAHSGASQSRSEAPEACGNGMCGAGSCQGGMCGMDFN